MAEIKTNIWDVKYRPKTFDEYIHSNKTVVEKLKEYIKNDDIPHILLHGKSGTGKSSLNDILLNELRKKGSIDVLEVNASDDSNLDFVKKEIKGFATSGSFSGRIKIVRLEEFRFSKAAQITLNEYLEKYFNNCRFLITTNYLDTVIPSIQSRFKKGTFFINSPDKKDIAKFVETILKSEQVEYNIKDVAKIINKEYPDIRSILGETQKNILNSKLELNEENFVGSNYLEEIFNILKDKKIDKNNSYVKIRQALADARIYDYQPIFRYVYDKVNELTPSISLQANIDYILAETQKDVMSVVDKEINMMSGFNRIISELKS